MPELCDGEQLLFLKISKEDDWFPYIYQSQRILPVNPPRHINGIILYFYILVNGLGNPNTTQDTHKSLLYRTD